MRKYTGRIDGKEFTLEVHNGEVRVEETSYKVTKDGKERYIVETGKETLEVDFVQRKDDDTFFIGVDGYTFEISLEDPMQSLVNDSNHSSGKVESPMAGVITSVITEEGEEVKEGDVLLVLSAMKMENEITSPVSGTVKKVHCKVDMQVVPGELLVEIHEE